MNVQTAQEVLGNLGFVAHSVELSRAGDYHQSRYVKRGLMVEVAEVKTAQYAGEIVEIHFYGTATGDVDSLREILASYGAAGLPEQSERGYEMIAAWLPFRGSGNFIGLVENLMNVDFQEGDWKVWSENEQRPVSLAA